MGIGRIGGFYQNYSVDSIQKVDLETVKAQDEAKKQQETQIPAGSVSIDTAPADDKRSKTADLENISLNFNAGETYDYIGKDSELSSLDMEQAISDMKKDQVLEQYQYFVGTDLNQTFASNDGTVILK